ncbi:Type 1 glutamine amidotransferase-like domain-containing protein [Alkanindiges illinoisensis]|uniref:Type 1 glutamine amidotransferase-like domain-containing protein n=1 Tax=Alkanindiges illinoisensis TaxID=197183 RepID=UPI000479856F|nr:Type 1 glutamine amidotransferase-like domain-containing protein [Alkanindiges illinoisensis]
MKKLFLASSFADVSQYFSQFIGENIQGKTVTFIPTASNLEDINHYMQNDKKAFEALGIKVDELDVAEATPTLIQQKITSNDYIFIGGGNTFYLLHMLKESGADQLIIQQIQQGKPYIGTSAGSVIVAPNIEYIGLMDEKDKAPLLTDYIALNMVDFYPLPHYGNPPFKETAEQTLNKYQQQLHLYPISNTQFISVKDNDLQIGGMR